MSVLPTFVDTASEEYQRNYAAMRALLDEFEQRQETVRQGGGERGQRKFRERGKLLPRERVELLLDPGTPFLELSTLAAWGMYNDESPGASGINGIGVVSGVECMICANDATAKGGASYPMSVKKALRAQEIAARNRLPCVYLVESAGANLLYQAEFFADLGGRTFANQSRMSAAGIPQIALVFGSSTAGGAYVPGLSDYTVLVKGQAKVFLGGPPLVKMATGEEVDDESLGGAEMHTRLSGVGDYLAEDDADAIRIGREIVGRLNWRKEIKAALATPEEPKYDPDELLGVIPADPRKPLEIREVIARLVDGSRLDEFKQNYGTTLVTGFAHLNGFPVGILANNGVLFSDSSMKAAQFIQLCQPVAHAADLPAKHHGLHGRAQVRGGGDHQARREDDQRRRQLDRAAVHRDRRRLAIGAGNYGMCGRTFDPTLLFSWPNSRIAVMGAEQAAGVLAIVQEDAARARGKEPDTRADRDDARDGDAEVRGGGLALLRDGAPVGRWHPRSARDTHGAHASASRCPTTAIGSAQGPPHYGVFRM